MKVWKCHKCGEEHPGHDLNLETVECKCGIGMGLWGVATVGNHVKPEPTALDQECSDGPMDHD